jgi:hypothetical protein
MLFFEGFIITFPVCKKEKKTQVLFLFARQSVAFITTSAKQKNKWK